MYSTQDPNKAQAPEVRHHAFVVAQFIAPLRLKIFVGVLDSDIKLPNLFLNPHKAFPGDLALQIALIWYYIFRAIRVISINQRFREFTIVTLEFLCHTLKTLGYFQKIDVKL